MDEFRRVLLRSVALATIIGFSMGALLGAAITGVDCPRVALSRDQRL